MRHSGHDEPWRAWHAALSGPRMHHAWMLAGKRGIGKLDFALAAARELVAEDGFPQPKGDHPDILLLEHLPANAEEEKKKAEGKEWQPKRNISIDQIREMQHRLVTRPTLGNRRAVIISPADDLEKGGANALLKSLEEPPQGTFFLLVTHRPGRLLPTIRSRCRVLRFGEARADEVEAYLAREAPTADPAERALAASAAGGSPGAALEFLSHDLAPLHLLMQRILAEGDESFVLRGELANAIGQRPARERQLAAIELARAVIAQEMRRASLARIPAIVSAHGDINRLAAQAPTYNFDPALLVMEIGSLLASAAQPREPAHG
ncbi:DNA polymerase III subunit delta' [Altererythrobacter sp. CC-YST694]|uniref:DNA polymerase III subunit delta' n=1 Tax=Altererythrobacter sp. CC-YST694 TaxID=2755038 RepID=UPI001D02F23B|nr:DNA polymerase III subunit delta' [Altererythrobacter sp. CC-YST694]MCB5424517.1 DNA polymerase III subunit delta' [Altererythrobacter sp. CC-YST694]